MPPNASSISKCNTHAISTRVYLKKIVRFQEEFERVAYLATSSSCNRGSLCASLDGDRVPLLGNRNVHDNSIHWHVAAVDTADDPVTAAAEAPNCNFARLTSASRSTRRDSSFSYAESCRRVASCWIL